VPSPFPSCSIGARIAVNAGGAEYTCLDYLDSMMARIAEIYEPGVEFTLVFTILMRR